MSEEIHPSANYVSEAQQSGNRTVPQVVAFRLLSFKFQLLPGTTSLVDVVSEGIHNYVYMNSKQVYEIGLVVGAVDRYSLTNTWTSFISTRK